MTLRSGGAVLTTWAAMTGVRPCFSTALLAAQSLSARPLRCCDSSTAPPAVVITLASLLVAPIRPATVMTSLVVGGISAIAAAWLSARLAGSMRTKTTRYGSRKGDWRTASCKRAGCNPLPSSVSRPKSETSAARHSSRMALAFSSTRKRSSPWSSSAVALARPVVRGMWRSYLQRQGDGPLLVCSQDVGRVTGRKATGPARRDELGGGGDRFAVKVGREAAPATDREKKFVAWTAQSGGRDGLCVEVEVAEIAEGAAVGRNDSHGEVGRAGLVAGSAGLRRENLQLEARESQGPAGPQ